MHTAAEKTSHTATPVRTAAAQGAFFRKADEPAFFGAEHDRGQSSFFSAAVQAKLTVSQPDDPYEREADATAERVMRMDAPPAPGERKEEEVQRSPEAAEKEETAAHGPQVSRMSGEEEQVQARLQRSVQRQAYHHISRSAEVSAPLTDGSCGLVRCRGAPGGPAILQRKERGPPAVAPHFESALSASKGGGSPMPEGTRTGMEARFGADFSGVRIHTGTEAESLSTSIRAQAFAHGPDVYFNAGKWAPGTASGDFLLAHELTHTIQQGASPPHTPAAKGEGPRAIQRSGKQRPIQRSNSGTSNGAVVQQRSVQLLSNTIHRAAQDRPVPAQLDAAVSTAKGEEGKVNAGKAGADGNRVGWEHLVDYFKTVMGEDKVVPPGGASVPGAIAESDIRKQRTVPGPQMDNPRLAAGAYTRDAMPSWCGIFVFWALHKGGVPMKPWRLGGQNIRLDAAYPPGYIPKAGDIAYRDKHSHFAIVEKADATTVTSVNGNTAGEDNLGAQVQTRDHPLKSWTAFFDPLLMKDGELRDAQGGVQEPEKEKSLRDLRAEVFGVQRKETKGESGGGKQAGREALSNWHAHSDGSLQRAPVKADGVKEKEQDVAEDAVQAKLSRKEFATGEGNASLDATPFIQREADEEHGDRGPPVALRTPEEQVQGGWFDTAFSFANSAFDYVAAGLAEGKRMLLGEARDFAMAIPGYRALRVVLGEDPITSEHIDRNGHTFIEAAFDVMPGGRQLHTKLTELGALEEAALWIDGQILSITGMVNGVIGEIVEFWRGIAIEQLAAPRALFERAGNILYRAIQRVKTFAETAARELLETVKRWMLTQVVDAIRTRTPVYRLLQVILGQDPVTSEPVERNGTNILNALLDLGGDEGAEQRRQMQETGTFARVAGWIDEGIAVFGGAYDEIRAGFTGIWNMVNIDALMNPVGTFGLIWATFARPVQRVRDFVGRAARAILAFIKEVLMQRLSAWARGVRGYPLITVLIGQDPFTQQEVPRTVHNIVRGFMSLMEGGEEQYNQLRESGAIDRVVGRIEAAVARLGMTVEYVVSLFTALWNSFSLSDLADPVAAFGRILLRFGEPIGRLIDFVATIVRIVIETVLQLMNFPTGIIGQIIANAMAAFDRIKRDPVGFLKNLLRAVKQGFVQFFDHIVQHLTGGLVGWLMAELRDAGVPQLTDLSLRGVITWVLQVLNISMEAIWAKLAAHPRIGPERVARIRGMIGRLEGIWTFIQDVQERGMAAIWDKVQEQLSNLWTTILDSVKAWIMETIIGRVVTRLLSMLDPTGIMAVINSAIAMYRALQSFVRYIREMLEVVNSFVGGVAEIAGGNIRTAANFLERSMARAMPVVIGFLANQVGLSGIGGRIAQLIGAGRELVDQALTWLVDRAVNLGSRLLEMGRSAVGAVAGWLGLRKSFNLPNGETHEIYFAGSERAAQVMVASNTPRTVEDLVTARTGSIAAPALTPAQRSSLAAALLKKRDMDTYIRTNTAATPTSGTTTDALRPELDRRLDLIKTDLVNGDALAASNALPLSNVTYTTSGGGRAGSVIARPLTKLPGNTRGSTPVQNDAIPAGWNHIRTVEGARITMWVKAHMLNENLHGPGVDWNLVPASQRFNSAMRVGAERWAKEEVDKDEIIHYKAEVTSWHTDNSNPQVMNFFPREVTVTYGYMPDPAKGRSAETTVASIPYTNDTPPTAGAAAGPPSVNTMTRENVRATFSGVGSVDTIYSVRQGLPGAAYRDLAHMYLRLRDAYNRSAAFENIYWPIISQKYNFQNDFRF